VDAARPFLLNSPKIVATGSLLIDRRLSAPIASAIGQRILAARIPQSKICRLLSHCLENWNSI
ncbi:MAG TPA: hypothetical protein VK602_17795, partial [Phyllobacterium sp.]|nr:hypothetical protein [Phyllobacterium sp.]